MPSYVTRKTKGGTVVDVRFRITGEDGAEINKRLCGFPNKRAAQQGYLEFMKSYVPPVLTPSQDAPLPFVEVYALYLRKKEAELASSSYYDLQWVFEKFILPFFGEKDLQKLKKEDFVKWQTELWAEKNKAKPGELYTQKYLVKIRSTLSTFLSWCEEAYDVPNLLKTIRKPHKNERKKEMQIWELGEFIQFQNSVDDTLWKTFFMMLYYSGCRVGEILALMDADVKKSEDGYSVSISKSVTRKPTGSGKSFSITAPKTPGSNRTVLLPAVMTEQLDSYFAWKKKEKISGDFLFGGDAPLPQRTYQRKFDAYAKEAGLKRIRIHDLRHSHASLLIHMNVPITTVSKRLGHSSVKMTLERYAHCFSSGESEAISSLNQAISEAISE